MRKHFERLSCLLIYLAALFWTGLAATLAIDIDSAFNHQILSASVEYLKDSNGWLAAELVDLRQDWQIQQFPNPIHD